MESIARLERGSAVRLRDRDGSYIYGTIEDFAPGRSTGRMVAVVGWHDGKRTNIYLDRLEPANA